MSEKNLKSLRFHGLDDIYKIPSTAEDVGAATLEQVNQAMRKAAPRNLLDNSDFRNPVNQRGKTSLVANDNAFQYFIDRWCFVDWSKNDDGTLTLSDDGISVTNETVFFYQRYEKGHLKANTAYTLAVYYADGAVDVRQKSYPLLVVSTTNTAYDEVYFTVDSGKTVSKVALYEAVYAIDTLPEYQPKGYGAELAECRRYYQRVGQLLSTGAAATGFMFTATSARFVMSISPMRKINPTVTLVSSASQPSVISNGNVLAKGALTFITNAYEDAQHLVIVVTVSGGTQYANAVLMSDKDCYFEISADL